MAFPALTIQRLPAFILLVFLIGLSPACRRSTSDKQTIRVMTFNLEDVRTDDLLNPDHPRLRAAAAVVQALEPDVLLLNEIAYDQEGVPGFTGDLPPGSNGQRFADTFLAAPQGENLPALRYRAFMAGSNTGRASGFDLDHDGRAVLTYPVPASAAADGSPQPQTAEGRAYGNDNWGFGTFPGQYAMAILVKDGLELLEGSVRTFQHFRWKDLPGATRPMDPETGKPWYDDDVWNGFPLSSKSHWDVPVRLPGGRVIHLLASHPTPAAFDGPERRNRLRNRDEIRFWNAYVSGDSALYDDEGTRGGIEPGASFVILGDLNADPDEGGAIDDPIGSLLLSHPAINGAFVPRADEDGISTYPDLDDDDTARWGMRADYVLPSADLTVVGGKIVRTLRANGTDLVGLVSDHFPVFIDLTRPQH